MDIENYMHGFRSLISGAETMVPLKSGKMVKAINFDNAATSPPFTTVLNEIVDFAPWYSSIHRGAGYKSKLCTEIFEESRLKVMNFINADADKNTVIYVRNTTEAINKLSNRLCNNNGKCVVLSTSMEHHSNDLPWRKNFMVDYIAVDDCGRLCMDDLERKLYKYKGHVKFVSVAGASNVTGLINPIHDIARLVHKYEAMVCADCAQTIPHMPVNMKGNSENDSIDFIAFSAHKMYAPFGIGALVGPAKVFEKGDPDYVGGGTVKTVTPDVVKWELPPHKEEAGTPNIMGIIALTAAIDTLKFIGMDNIYEYEEALTKYLLNRMSEIPEIKIYGGTSSYNRVGIVPFNIYGMHHSKTAEVLSDEAGIAVRNGCFCAQPYIQRLLNISKDEMKKYIDNPTAQRPGMVRLSFGLYNDFTEIDRLIAVLYNILQNKTYYNKKF